MKQCTWNQSTHAEGARSKVACADGRVLEENPQVIVNGFIQARIAGALDKASNELVNDEYCETKESNLV